MRRMILAAALAAASFSLALAPAMANTSNPPIPGTTDLGVDISGAMLTPSGVHDFLSTLSPDVRQSVENACAEYVQYPDSADSVQTVNFCDQIHKA